MEKNTYELFNEVLNQSSNSEFMYACSVFASAANLSYNCWIKLTLEDMNTIVQTMVSAGTLNLTAWAKGVDAVNTVLQFIKDNAVSRCFKIPTLITITDDATVMEYINGNYAVMTGIMVNANFVKDVPDWVINTKDYRAFMGTDLKHYLNMLFSEWDWKDYLLDNYAWNTAGRQWLYECDFKQVLAYITQHTKYVFCYQ